MLALSVSGLLVILLRQALPDLRSAAIACTFLILAFFSYGHAYAIAKELLPLGITIGRHRYLIPLTLCLLLAVIIGLRMKRLPTVWPTAGLNIIGLVALVFQIVFLASPGARINSRPVSGGTLPESPPAETASRPLPDIYYIILDAYGRQDILNTLIWL